MKIGKKVTGIIVLLVVVAVAVTATDKMPKAQAEGQGAEVAAKIDEVLKGQQDVIRRLDEIKGELEIIKIRVTQMQ